MSNNTQELINSFKMLYAELKRAHFIMANKVIVKILKFVASNEELKFSIDHANQIYNFAEIYSAATENGRLVMPTDDFKIIVLVTGVLFNIDRGNFDFLTFIKENFPNYDLAGSFNDFCDVMIYSYIVAFENILSMDSKVVNIDGEVQNATLSRQLVDQLNDYIISMSDQIVSDNTLGEQRKNEFFALLEGFNYAIENGNTILIKAMWLGLKYALLYTKSYSSYIMMFENELKNYDIID